MPMAPGSSTATSVARPLTKAARITSAAIHSTSSARAASFNPKEIKRFDAKLVGETGAQDIIRDICSRRTVTKLDLGHNTLGDDGTVALFRFLERSTAKSGAKCKDTIVNINLSGNEIGDEGLLAIASFLTDNTALEELELQNNKISAAEHSLLPFIHAVNASHVRVLGLTGNPFHSPSSPSTSTSAFAALFFPALNAPHLRELRLNTLGTTTSQRTQGPHPLNPAAASYAADYLSDPERCKLHTFRCNASQFSHRGVKQIVRRAFEWKPGANFGLMKMDIYAYSIPEEDREVDPTAEDGAGGESNEDNGGGNGNVNGPARIRTAVTYEQRQQLQEELKAALHRNDHLRKETERDALALLRHARPVLLPSRRQSSCSPPSQPDAPRGVSGRKLADLPIELKLHILTFLAPSLSTGQRCRVVTYASNWDTLLPALPRLSPSAQSASSAHQCVPDPGSLPGLGMGMDPGGFGVGMGMGIGAPPSSTVKAPVWALKGGPTWSGGCSNGQCMKGNSLLCRREAERIRWLEAVECARYELDQ